jgi:hypothetical protein
MARMGVGHAQEPGDELAHAVIDLGEQIALGRVERVVEIEDPDPGRIEAAAARRLRDDCRSRGGARCALIGRH